MGTVPDLSGTMKMYLNIQKVGLVLQEGVNKCNCQIQMAEAVECNPSPCPHLALTSHTSRSVLLSVFTFTLPYSWVFLIP